MLEQENAFWHTGVSFVAGVDEVGRGALAGPVVAAAVILPRDMLIRGLKDSKRLSPAERDRLYTVISSAAISIGVGQSSPELIDEVNIRQANLLAMRQAVDNLEQSPEHLLIDGVDTIDWDGPQTTIVSGDG